MIKELIAIVGRPNVGKSTLFNKLVGKRTSIVDDQPGVTRDRIYGKAEWQGKEFRIIDTGGIEFENKPFQEQIKNQVQIAIYESKLIILAIDGKTGFTNDDNLIIQMLRKANKDFIIAANKLENKDDFHYSLWSTQEKLFPISAIHGIGIGDLLEEATKRMDKQTNEINKVLKICILGKPNAGKSSLLNKITNEHRSIVSPIKNTTRDSVQSFAKINGIDVEIIDTAGINRKSKLVESVDHYALNRAINSLEDSDVVILLLDAQEDISHFDSVIGGYAFQNEKPIVIVINKWDLINKSTNTMKQMEENIKKNFKFLAWAPIVFISAKNGDRLQKLYDKIEVINENLKKEIATKTVNDFLVDIQLYKPASYFNGGRLNLAFGKQINTKIPTFLIFVNNKKYLHFSYERYILNQFRKHFGFEGVPIKLIFRDKKMKEKKNE